MLNIAFLNDSPHSSKQATVVANKLGIDIIEIDDFHNHDAVLLFEDGRLCLRQSNVKNIKSICVDFASDKLQHRLKFGGGKSESIAKATGINKLQNPVIIDATAGLGTDSFILASLGCKVTMLERSKIIHALLFDAVNRSGYNEQISKIVSNLSLINCDSHDYITSLEAQTKPDIIYLDPMFPDRKKSALVKKEMRLFKNLIGTDPDADKLLQISLQRAKKRVVVKRPIAAKHLCDKKPDIIQKGKANRYDIYSITT